MNGREVDVDRRGGVWTDFFKRVGLGGLTRGKIVRNFFIEPTATAFSRLHTSTSMEDAKTISSTRRRRSDESPLLGFGQYGWMGVMMNGSGGRGFDVRVSVSFLEPAHSISGGSGVGLNIVSMVGRSRLSRSDFAVLYSITLTLLKLICKSSSASSVNVSIFLETLHEVAVWVREEARVYGVKSVHPCIISMGRVRCGLGWVFIMF